MRVIVIGAGIVGCATAYRLQREGHEVTLLDANSEVGRVSSYANGAQLSYSYVQPLATPGTLRALPGLLFERDAALRFVPKWDVQQWTWGLGFMSACTDTKAQRGTQALLELAALSRQTLEGWLQEEDWKIDFAQNGKLVLCRDKDTLAQQAKQVALQAKMGSVQQVMTPQQCALIEPALARMQTQLAGGIWTASECVADPYKLCQALSQSLVKRGGKLLLGHRVLSFERRADRVTGVRTNRSALPCDAVVIAAGTASRALARELDAKLPIYPLKGYSITVPVIDPAKLVRCSVTDLDRKMVLAPLGGQLRVAASVELVGDDMAIDPRRIQQMQDAVHELFPGACDLRAPKAWAGLRPATPDSIPIIGLASPKLRNAYLNVGHGALGLTLAAGSAARLAALL